MSPLRSILLATSLITSVVSAHESPEHNIKHLSTHIETDRSADNLFQRAIAYRAVGQLDKATTDLNDAIKLAPNNLGYHLEFCRVQLAQSKFGKALHTANHALKLSNTPNQRATCHILRAEAYHRSRRPKPALQSCQLAFKEVPKGEIEWFLLRSENQLSLGKHQQRITDLKSGHALHHSAVLKAHWIDAIIDSSDFQTALPLIESELTNRRWKSSWLIKRARALQGLRRNTEASADLHAALAEINTRLNPARPDPLLLADQGITYALLGDKVAAKTSLKKLHRINAPHWITNRLELKLHKN